MDASGPWGPAWTFKGTRGAGAGGWGTALAVHLESGDNVVILEGLAREAREASELELIDKAYFVKYKMHILAMPGDVVMYALQPRVAFAWREKDFNVSATRWLLR